ncbi:MAG: transposase [Muribaculaceae bacterium]|nr:transposase [Muribaculaceae bacterium]
MFLNPFPDFDGNKRIKGIKRHIAVDSHGYLLGARITTANVHDSKGAIPLIAKIIASNPDLKFIKADLGYRPLAKTIDNIDDVYLACVQSNFGTYDFITIEGRWGVERTI